MTGPEKTISAITIALVVLIVVSGQFFSRIKNIEPEIHLPYYHADSLEALNWKRASYLDSVFRYKLDSVSVPYRKLFEEHADSTGIDWKLLASIAYQESRFDLHAESHKGAVGLMQITSATALRYGVENSHDPSQNISAGAFWMKDLFWRYRGCTSDKKERLKLSLAAYNAGPTHITHCIDTLLKQGIEVHSWDDISEKIGEMDFFNAEETDTFVRRVQYIYDHFQNFR